MKIIIHENDYIYSDRAQLLRDRIVTGLQAARDKQHTDAKQRFLTKHGLTELPKK